MTIAPPGVPGPYEVLGEIARGGMGLVLRGRSREGREVAIKVLHKASPDGFARFERERRLLQSLGERDGFVELLDAGTGSLGPFIVMPLLTGGTLRARLVKEERLSIEETIALGKTLARAFSRAQQDLSPDLARGLGQPREWTLPDVEHWRARPYDGNCPLTETLVVKGTELRCGKIEVLDTDREVGFVDAILASPDLPLNHVAHVTIKDAEGTERGSWTVLDYGWSGGCARPLQ